MMQASSTDDKVEKKAGPAFCRFVPGYLSAPVIAPLLIFAFAFFLRYLYNAVFMEHRIAHFGDAYNFLRSGSCLLEALVSSHNPAELITRIYHAAAPQAQLLQSMSSMKLTDRLLIDGPVYPAYLAAVEWLIGVDPANPIFDPHTVQISLCNSFIDSLSCLLVYICGRLAFNTRTAVVAGLLFAVYPAAIINTQHCYSEPFSYFLLNIWTALCLFVLLRHAKGRPGRVFAWCGLGLCSSLMMLAKPAFVLLPALLVAVFLPVLACKHVVARRSGEAVLPCVLHRCGKYLSRGALAGCAALLVLIPWIIFNKTACGQYSILVNRVPSFNIFHGNQIGTDGWRCYPFYGCFPGESKLVIASLLKDAQQEPLLFVGLQFKKVARLWSGVWNEYHYDLFGLPLPLQSLFHQLLLFVAVLSLSYLLFSPAHKTLSRKFSAGLVLGTIVLFHFAYIPFESISRYASTAMPAVILLAAFFVVESVRRRNTGRALFFALSISAFSFWIISASGVMANLLSSLLPTAFMYAAPCLSALLEGCLFVAIFVCGTRVLSLLDNKPYKTCGALFVLPGLFTCLVATVAGFYTIQSHDWKEWSCSINSRQSVRQTIFINPELYKSAAGQPPEDRPYKSAFILVDLSADTLSPPVRIKLNGQMISETLLPLAQLQPNNLDILQCLAIQAEGMSLDLRTFRNWWVLPFSLADLKPGENTIELSCPADSARVRVYGDLVFPALAAADADADCYLPSLRSFSYTKGFTTFDYRDTRVFEKVYLQGKTIDSCRLLTGNKAAGAESSGLNRTDLSEATGRQYGRYRIRIIVPQLSVSDSGTHAPAVREFLPAELSALIRAPIAFIGADRVHLVEGSNPLSFEADRHSFVLPAGLPAGARFDFRFESRRRTGLRSYFVGLEFSGLDRDNVKQVWSSRWQPIAISPERTFRQTSFSDIIPSEILSLKDLQVRALFSPFQPDYLYLKRKEALKCSIEIRAVRLFFLKPLDLPPLAARKWLVY